MSLLVGVGSSIQTVPKDAISEAYEAASTALQGSPPHMALLFASSKYPQQELVDALKQKVPMAVRVGCSTAGEITNDGSRDRSVALMLLSSDSIKIIAGTGNQIKDQARASGASLAHDIQQKGNGIPKAMIMLPDGLAGNGADIVRGVLDVYGNNFGLAGGSAGDDYEFSKTYQYYGDALMSGSVVGVGLYGNIHVGVGVRHGWVPIGNPRIATRSLGNVLYELDGKPAINMYKDQFGDQTIITPHEPLAKLAVTYPLGIPSPNNDGYLIRDPLTVDERGAITCAAEIPQGSEVYLMIGGQQEAIDAARDAAKQAVRELKGVTPKAALLFNCIARKRLLMQKKQQEIDTIREVIGKEVPLIGFYTYGEQAPLGSEILTCSFHNETDVLCLLGETP